MKCKLYNEQMLLIAHRGDTISFKPNTLEAFLSAFDKGADGIELDVHLFRNEIIVVHDFLKTQLYQERSEF